MILLRTTLLTAGVFALFQSSVLVAASNGIYEYTDIGGAIRIDQHIDRGARGNIVVPSLIDGKPVTQIGDGAFKWHYYVRGVFLPDSVQQIGSDAFWVCYDLEQIRFPKNLLSIGIGAFSSCESLRSAVLPEGLKIIESGAFGDNYSLSEVRLPSSLTKLGSYAFAGTSIRRIDIPKNLRDIEAGTFAHCSRLRQVTLPQSLRSIKAQAFESSGLESVVLPASLRMVEAGVFKSCKKLSTVKFRGRRQTIPESTFEDCSQLQDVQLPRGLRTIGPKAFQGCKSLLSVSIPSSVNSIGKGAFSNCRALAGVSFQGNAPNAGADVFQNTASGLKVFINEKSKLFTSPRWKGYRIAINDPEIAITNPMFKHRTDGEQVVNFSNQRVSGRGERIEFLVWNVGNRPLDSLDASVTGPARNDFVVIKVPRKAIAPGESAKLEILFKPISGGRREATLNFRSNDADENPFSISLKGIGLTQIK